MILYIWFGLSEEQLIVRRIKDGTVIDHCEPGSALKVLAALGIKEGCTNLVTIAMNVPSKKLGKKDIVKIADRFLTQGEANRIALISPRATLNLIKDYRVISKSKVELPEVFVNIFKCPNPTCISNANEPIVPEILVIKTEPPKLMCKYCSRVFNVNELTLT